MCSGKDRDTRGDCGLLVTEGLQQFETAGAGLTCYAKSQNQQYKMYCSNVFDRTFIEILVHDILRSNLF